ncbi:polyphosphate--glucose phosphotransferase [Streptomyces sp. SID3343]|uniref:polyphosphate--glucose phosphotransferase n=1 Tax=Streptomyces sp. SID3343 TaxID=2690260 RepID=UPI00136A31CB|nr:ROK family protein [Streptomyces sp. SID3343]
MPVMGIDIGGTGIKGAPVDTEAGRLTHERVRLLTPEPSEPQAVIGVVREVLAQFPDADGPVGITFPGVIKNGIARSAANVDKSWIDLDVDALFTATLGRPVTMVNDADAAGVAEMRFGAGRGHKGTVLMLTFGTGIGSALFVDGRLVPNTELGHLELNGHEAEHRASAVARETHDLSWEKWSARVQDYLRHVEMLFSPSLVIIGGGISKKPEKFIPYLKIRADLVPATLHNDAGIVGAAMLVIDEGRLTAGG